MTDTKPSNPKDGFGSAKCPLGLVPDTGDVEVAAAFLEGALKYGRYNWRVAGVRASIYNDAMERHRKKWWNGQDRDPVTRVKELASIIACCKILIDAEMCGMLEDDRPPAVPIGEQLDDQQALISHLKELFRDHNPVQYTQKSHPRSQEHIPAGISYKATYMPVGKTITGADHSGVAGKLTPMTAGQFASVVGKLIPAAEREAQDSESVRRMHERLQVDKLI